MFIRANPRPNALIPHSALRIPHSAFEFYISTLVITPWSLFAGSL